jgi:uncharacterized repeat protein (TIGR01451 family)
VTVNEPEVPDPTVSLKVNGVDGPVTFQEPASYTLSWNSDNANSCSASGAWSGTKVLSGSQAFSNVSDGDYTYTITCANTHGSASDAVTVHVNRQATLVPTVDLKVNGSDGLVSVMVQDSYTLSWVSSNADSCSASGSWTGSRSVSGSQTYTAYSAGTFYYYITCTGSNGSASDSVSVTTLNQNLAYLSINELVRNRTTGTGFSESVNASAGDDVEFQVTVSANGSGTAQNTYVQAQLPSYLDYTEGSVQMDNYYSGYYAYNYNNSDVLVSSGISLGDLNVGNTRTIKFVARVLSGVPAGTNALTVTARAWANNVNQVSDTAQALVWNGSGSQQASLSVAKTSRDLSITTASAYYQDLYTAPSRTIEFSIAVTGIGSYQSTDVTVRDYLPDAFIYQSGSATLDGYSITDGIVSNGVNIGTVSAGQTRTVRFRALVRDNSYFTQAVTKYVNTASASGGNTSGSTNGTANVWVVRTGRVLGATTVDTGADLGSLGAMVTSVLSALGFTGLQIGRKLYWRSKIALVRSLGR